ncbi:MAG: FAD-dependent oxidoreductase, partial [Deltaproteobacteria bacterium]|nr:FAD-dependent oxidoreductase [Deltaproteobacteria bacterium]
MGKFEVTIIGAGIVGLALAARLAPKLGSELLLIEQHDDFGRETSSRNSEIIHAGIYYPKDSLKARLCISGCRQIYKICQNHDIAHQRLGKIIVATSREEEASLVNLWQRGRENGVTELKLLSAAESRALEPEVKAQAALLSPATGIVDSHSLMRFFYQQAKTAQATIAFNSKIAELMSLKPGFLLRCESHSHENFSFKSRVVINCAGLDAARLSSAAGLKTP